MVTVPRYRNTYLFSQQGVFTLYPRANRYFFDERKWPNLNDVIQKNCAREKEYISEHYGKLIIDASHTDDILKRLFQFGISRSSMMPSLDNIAHAVPYQRKLFDLSFPSTT
jgi:hypothetical protein